MGNRAKRNRSCLKAAYECRRNSQIQLIGGGVLILQVSSSTMRMNNVNMHWNSCLANFPFCNFFLNVDLMSTKWWRLTRITTKCTKLYLVICWLFFVFFFPFCCQNMSDAMAILHKLQTGLDVNVKFTGVRVFEYTPECIVFDLLDIPLYHGWLVDPQVTFLVFFQ